MKEKQLLKTVTGFRAGILGKQPSNYMCFAVCAPLQGYLSMLGCEAAMIDGEVDAGEFVYGHVWLELPDGKIIDPTADQIEGLNLPPVYIGPMPPSYSKEKTWDGTL
jgi:hypothetical protein